MQVMTDEKGDRIGDLVWSQLLHQHHNPEASDVAILTAMLEEVAYIVDQMADLVKRTCEVVSAEDSNDLVVLDQVMCRALGLQGSEAKAQVCDLSEYLREWDIVHEDKPDLVLDVKQEFSDCEGGVDIDPLSPSFDIDVKVELHEDEQIINKIVKSDKRKARLDHQSGAKTTKGSQPKEYEYDPLWTMSGSPPSSSAPGHSQGPLPATTPTNQANLTIAATGSASFHRSCSKDVVRKSIEQLLRSGKYCCVVGCNHNSARDKQFKYWKFPVRNEEQRALWIKAVHRVNPDGSDWIPGKTAIICSAHFLNGEKSLNRNHPSYKPTIFPKNKT